MVRWERRSHLTGKRIAGITGLPLVLGRMIYDYNDTRNAQQYFAHVFMQRGYRPHIECPCYLHQMVKGHRHYIAVQTPHGCISISMRFERALVARHVFAMNCIITWDDDRLDKPIVFGNIVSAWDVFSFMIAKGPLPTSRSSELPPNDTVKLRDALWAHFMKAPPTDDIKKRW